MTPPRTRPATVGDVDGIVEVFRQCWVTDYGRFLPASAHAAMPPEAASALWHRTLTAADGSEVVVATAVDGHRILGVTRWSGGGGAVGMVHSLYVAPGGQGRGTGGLLLSTAVGGLVARGATRGLLWVFEANLPARAFYERQGWRANGQQRTEPEFGVPELQFERSLLAGPPS